MVRFIFFIGCFPHCVADDLAVLERDHAVGIGLDARVVGDQDDGLLVGVGEALHHRHHLLGGFGVQVAGGLIGKDHRGPVHKGPGDAHPLLLAT